MARATSAGTVTGAGLDGSGALDAAITSIKAFDVAIDPTELTVTKGETVRFVGAPKRTRNAGGQAPRPSGRSGSAPGGRVAREQQAGGHGATMVRRSVRASSSLPRQHSTTTLPTVPDGPPEKTRVHPLIMRVAAGQPPDNPRAEGRPETAAVLLAGLAGWAYCAGGQLQSGCGALDLRAEVPARPRSESRWPVRRTAVRRTAVQEPANGRMSCGRRSTVPEGVTGSRRGRCRRPAAGPRPPPAPGPRAGRRSRWPPRSRPRW